jgi:hypothetical protein
MFKKTLTFTDFNGDVQTKDFYFHMSKLELLEMAADGNAMMERIKRIIADNNGRAIIREFRLIIMSSCGMRSEDGSRFLKTPEAQSTLMDSPAFDELLMELCTKADAAAEFVRMLIPDSMQKEMQAQLEAQKKDGETVTIDPFKEPADDDPRPLWMKENRNPTQQELMAMSKEEMAQAFQLRK